MISVVIPTYKEPNYLDICLKSCIENQYHNNQIIVVIDGFSELNEHVIHKYQKSVLAVKLKQNKGISVATNIGVNFCHNELILVVNDDNVFPKDWDKILLERYKDLTYKTGNKLILTPNQIEPEQSIFKSFIQHDFGRTYDKFNLEEFNTIEPTLRNDKTTNDGYTLPFLMKKKDFMIVGGWDISYKSPHVVDWDFFLKLQLNDVIGYRLHHLNFYHFGGKATKNTDKDKVSNKTQFDAKEKEAYKQFFMKWGYYPCHNDLNIKKPLDNNGVVKGVDFYEVKGFGY